jgi:cyclohexyl-isocyanide hydratase
MSPEDQPLKIGALLFDGLDQIDLTGPFEVLSRIPNSTYRIYGKSLEPVRDVKGLQLTPEATLNEAPQLDLLHIPGGPGQKALMEDEAVLGWVRHQAAGARIVFSVCTGALICGAAGLLKERQATTHWTARHLLPYFGALPSDERVVVDGIWSAPPGSQQALTGRCWWRRCSEARRPPKPSSSICNTCPSPLSTPGRRKRPRPRSLRACAHRLKTS